MSTYTSRLVFEPTPFRRNKRPVYRLLAPFSYAIGAVDSGVNIDVPSGFLTDFASIPTQARAVFPPNGPWAKAAVLHDYLYENGKLPRWLADRVFLEGMEVLKVPFAYRMIMYVAVRLFGWRSFGKRSENDRLTETQTPLKSGSHA